MISSLKSVRELEEHSCHVYATMVNTRNPDLMKDIIDDSCVRTSQHSFTDIEGKTAILEHYRKLFEKFEQSNVKVYAEIGRVPIPGFGFHFHSTSTAAKGHAQREARSGPMYYRPCCVISVNRLHNIECLVLFEVKDDKVINIKLCQAIPHPLSAERTGVFPGKGQ